MRKFVSSLELSVQLRSIRVWETVVAVRPLGAAGGGAATVVKPHTGPLVLAPWLSVATTRQW